MAGCADVTGLVRVLLDLLDLHTEHDRTQAGVAIALEACIDSLRVSLVPLRPPPTISLPAQVLVERAIHAVRGDGDGGWRIADALDVRTGQVRTGDDDDGLATWIAGVLVGIVREDPSADRVLWERASAALAGAVERIELTHGVIVSWEFAADQPIREAELIAVIAPLHAAAPPLRAAAALDALLHRAVMAVVATSDAPWWSQVPRISAALLIVRQQVIGVQAALRASLHQRDRQTADRGAGGPYGAIA